MFKCLIYTTTDLTEDVLIDELSKFLGEDKSSISFITVDKYDLFVQENDEFDEYEQTEFPDGFLHFRHLIDIQFQDGTSEGYCIDETGKILRWLWGRGFAAVASCDYEHLLPENGGYNSRNTPWVS